MSGDGSAEPRRARPPLDPTSRTLLAGLAAAEVPPLHRMTADEARALPERLGMGRCAGPGMAWVVDAQIGPDQRVRVRFLIPPGTARGLLVYFHGGGWVLGGVGQSDGLARTLAARTGCVVVLVGYRLAPEHRYPTAAEDAWTALNWAAARTRMFVPAVPDAPLIVAGDSAGGNLAAVVARRARDAGGPRIALQVLVCPTTDCDLDRPSYLDPANQLLVGREEMAWFWDHYAPSPESRREPDAAPLRVADLSRLPPALVLLAGYDVLRDEGEAYAARLREAGVPVTIELFADQMHGFFTMIDVLPGSACGIAAVVRAVDALTDGTPRTARPTRESP